LLQFVPRCPQSKRPVMQREEIAHHPVTFTLCRGSWGSSRGLFAVQNWQFHLFM
jgi:hypothetical protein